jgi:ribonuclease VapC
LTIFVDASALVAMAVREPEARALSARLDAHNDRLYCATGGWEAIMAIARIRSVSLEQADAALKELLYSLSIRIVTIGDAEERLAIIAAAHYGKGRHPARLNMGDCFAYACAKTNGAELLYKGNDFALTDLA